MQENTNIIQGMQTNKIKQLLPVVAVALGGLLLILSFFLPFASATEDYRDYLEENPSKIYYDEIDMTNDDAINISLLEFTRIYGSSDSSDGTLYVIIYLLFASFAVLTTLFAMRKKAILTIIFNALSFGAFSLIKWDLSDRGILPSRSYDFGIVNTIFYIGCIIMMAYAIYLLILKSKNNLK